MTRRIVTICDSVEAMPLLVLMESYLETKRLSPRNTYRATERVLNDFIDYLADALELKRQAVLWQDITRDSILAWKQHLQENYAPSTAHQRVSLLRSWTKFVASKHKCSDVAVSVVAPSKGRTLFRGITEVQYSSALKIAERQQPLDRFLIELLMWTGLRCNEARCLTLGQISDDWKWIVDVVGKRRKLRNIPISKELRRSLMRYLDWRHQWPTRPEYPLLLSERGYRLRNPQTLRVSQKTIYRKVNKTLLAAGVPDDHAHPHACRHTFAHRTLDELGKKLPSVRALQVLQQLLGHSDMKTTLHYSTKDDDFIFHLVEDLR